jgi:hypothetical protein
MRAASASSRPPIVSGFTSLELACRHHHCRACHGRCAQPVGVAGLGAAHCEHTPCSPATCWCSKIEENGHPTSPLRVCRDCGSVAGWPRAYERKFFSRLPADNRSLDVHFWWNIGDDLTIRVPPIYTILRSRRVTQLTGVGHGRLISSRCASRLLRRTA